MNGNNPTLKISVIDTGENINRKRRGKRLISIATNLQFNLSNH